MADTSSSAADATAPSTAVVIAAGGSAKRKAAAKRKEAKRAATSAIIDGLVPDTIYHAITFLGIPDFLACLRVTREFRDCARLRPGSKRDSPWRSALAALDDINRFDTCEACEKKACRNPACDNELAWRGDVAEAAADAAPRTRISFRRSDPRRRPTFTEQEPLASLRQMVRFTRACVRRLSDHAMAGVDRCLANKSTWCGEYDMEQAADDKERKFFSEMNSLCSARSGVLHELAQLNVSRREFFSDDARGAMYWFLRDMSQEDADAQNGGVIGIDMAWGSSLRDETSSYVSAPFGLTFDDEITFDAAPELSSATAGSDEHIEFMIDLALSESEKRLVAIFGEEQFERDFDVVARFSERWPSIKKRLHELDLEDEELLDRLVEEELRRERDREA